MIPISQVENKDWHLKLTCKVFKAISSGIEILKQILAFDSSSNPNSPVFSLSSDKKPEYQRQKLIIFW